MGKLTDKELEFYSRQIMLKDIGYRGQMRLKDSLACIVGLGGLGSSVAIKLAAMGVGTLRLVDRDVVEISNLQRQHLYDSQSLGKPKVEVASRKLQKLNPYIKIEIEPLSINFLNAQEIVAEADVVVDGLDAMLPRYAINRACVREKIPYVFGAAISTFGNVSTIIPGETPCLECFYGGIVDEDLPTCAVVGIHPSMLGVISSVEVAETVRILIGQKPQLAGELLYAELDGFSIDRIKVSRREDCLICGEGEGEAEEASRKLIEEVCGRGGERTFILVPRENLNLDMDALKEVFVSGGFEVGAATPLGLTVRRRPKVKISVLKSGVMITEGISDKEELIGVYREKVSEGLKIPWGRIE